MQTYSFLDVQASLVGPGGSLSLGSGAGASEEGLSVEFNDETDNIVIGADGSGMHSLHANKSGRVTVRLLKTSPTNAALHAMYNFQRSAGSRHGKNTLTITDVVRGDVYTCQQVAFAKAPTNAWGKDAGTIEWQFNSLQIDPLLGAGL